MARINLSALAARITGSRRPAADDPAVSPIASEAAPTRHGVDQLSDMRNLVLGGLPRDYTGALARIEERAAAAVESLGKEIGAMEQRIEQRLSQIHSDTGKGHAQLREQLSSNLRLLNEAIGQSNADSHGALEKGRGELESAKLDRAALASALAKLGDLLRHPDVRTDAEKSR